MKGEQQKPKIAISEKTKAELDKLIVSKQDTYEDIILRLIEKQKGEQR